MKRLLLFVGAVATAYQVGAGLGFSLGVANGRRLADGEWARALEYDMVGPGSTTVPTGAPSALRMSGGV